jgi:hypothetical protein
MSRAPVQVLTDMVTDFRNWWFAMDIMLLLQLRTTQQRPMEKEALDA